MAAQAVGPRGVVVGIDLKPLDPPLDNANVVALTQDLEELDVEGVLRLLGGRAHVLLSDAAPKLTGIRDSDRAREERLLEAIEGLVPVLLEPDGRLLVKILESPEARAVDLRLRKRFERARTVKPAATRRGSSERYLLASGYRGA